MTYVEASAQGSLLKIKQPFLYAQFLSGMTGKKRGEIKMFTRESRKRMLDKVATMDISEGCRFVTLTYSDDTIAWDGEKAKAHLRALFERLRRAAPEASAVWRMELKPRLTGRFIGQIVPHFHMLVFGADDLERPQAGVRKNYTGWFNENWAGVIGHYDYYRRDGRHDLNTEDKQIANSRQAMYYVAKYAAKIEDDGSSLGNDAYPHAGRFWGVHNKDFLPVCPLEEVAFWVHEDAFETFREAAVSVWSGIAQKRRSQGFTLYHERADCWLIYLEWCRQAYHPSKMTSS